MRAGFAGMGALVAATGSRFFLGGRYQVQRLARIPPSRLLFFRSWSDSSSLCVFASLRETRPGP